MINKTNVLKENFKDNIFYNETLSKYSWFNLGGPAEIFFKPKSIEQLSSFLKNISNDLKKINVIGAGSNTLIRDNGIKGVTIKLSPTFASVNLIDKDLIKVGAATLDRQLSNFATDNSLSGLEFLSCIPGSIGGGIIMNSGCYEHDISQILVSVEVMDQNGLIKKIKATDIKFTYRGSDLPKDLIILSAIFKAQRADIDSIKKKQNELVDRKKKDQPSRVKTCGSTFKNPINKKAWKLIKDSNCHNYSVGQAKISKKHCNFFINEGKATSSDIENLIKKVQETVLKKTGINLELEIKIIGK
ncbi:UDP-N-acetylmuramate dehydrogenase [Pelagibacteraceae bacterium]|nr:UDP-N-acetylmuramate dehydrogenase [Pelagibacteraceae bacterium]